jgi:hypothetical protein
VLAMRENRVGTWGMAVKRTGVFFEDTGDGFYSYGDGGVGGLTVNGGSFYSLPASNGTDEGFFQLGAGAAGIGSVSITAVVTGTEGANESGLRKLIKSSD